MPQVRPYKAKKTKNKKQKTPKHLPGNQAEKKENDAL